MSPGSLRISAQEVGRALEREVTLEARQLGLEPADARIHVRFRVVACGGEALLNGCVRAAFRGECAVCLTPVDVDLEEAFCGSHRLAPDAVIDLLPHVRDAFMAGVPMRIKCSPDCRGLCPRCGKNLNEGPCTCPAAEAAEPLKHALDEALDRGSS